MLLAALPGYREGSYHGIEHNGSLLFPIRRLQQPAGTRTPVNYCSLLGVMSLPPTGGCGEGGSGGGWTLKAPFTVPR